MEKMKLNIQLFAYSGTWTKVGSDWSTLWIISDGSSPSTGFGDVRPYFRTYYDQDLVANKTKIRINKYAQGYNLNQLTGEGVGELIARSVISGTTQSGSTTLPKTSGYTLTFIESDDKEITHNADGTCNTVTYSGNGYADGVGGPSSTKYTSNKTFTPPTIPRKFSIAMSNFTINESISPITSAITIGVTSTSFTCNLDYIFYKITSDATYQADKEYYSKSGTTFTLLIAGTNYTVGNAIVGTIYDTIAGNIVDGITQSSYVWTLSSELLTSIYNGSPNSATVYGKITCETFNGETSLGSNVVNFNVIMTDTPSIASVSYETTDALSIGYDVTKQTVIKDISNISITLTPTFPTGASLYRYTVVCGDYTGYFNSLPIAFSAVKDDAVVITATDTRGAFYSYELTLTPFINYSTPAFINAETTVVRNGQLSGEVNLTTNGTWFYGDFATGSPNDIAVYFKYWKTSDAEPSDASYIEIPSGDITKNIDGTWEISSLTLEDAMATVIDDVDYNYSYYFKLKVVDETTSKHEITKTVTVGVPVMTEHKEYVDFKNATIKKVQVATETYVNTKTATKCILRANATAGQTLTSTAETLIPITQSVKAGTGLSISNDADSIVIGEGITKVLVSGNVYFSTGTSDGDSARSAIYINASRVASCWQRAGGTIEDRPIPPRLVDVEAGDEVYLYFANATGARGSMTTGNTYLQVEVVE